MSGQWGLSRAPVHPVSQVTSYGGELRFTVTQRPQPGSTPLHGQPMVVLQGNGIVLEHHTSQEPSPGQPSTFTVPFREVSSTPWGLAWGGASIPQDVRACGTRVLSLAASLATA